MTSEENGELKLAVRETVHQGRERLGSPPSEEELIAYHRKELSPEEADRIQELLAHYPESVRQLADLAALEAQPGDPDYLSDEDLERDWDALKRQVEVEEHPPGTASNRVRKLETQLRYSQIAAVVTFALFIGSLFFLGSPARQTPRPLVVSGRLLQPDGQRRGAAETAIQMQARLGESYVLVPALIDLPTYRSYRIEIFEGEPSPDKSPIFVENGISLDADGNLYIVVPPGTLRLGRHVIRLLGVNPGSGPKVLATYTVDW